MLVSKGLEPPAVRSRRRFSAAACLVLAACFASGAVAEGITIEHASSKLVGDTYFLDAKIRYEFDEEILVALQHGVEINVEIVVRAKRERKWLWDPVVGDRVFKFSLEHHPLSDDYVVTDLDQNVSHQFPSEAAAIRFLGTMENRPFLAAADVREGTTHTGQVRAKLNLDLLPVPLQPAAYVSKEWRLQSPWYEWTIR